jgi:hypothetical protein
MRQFLNCYQFELNGQKVAFIYELHLSILILLKSVSTLIELLLKTDPVT